MQRPVEIRSAQQSDLDDVGAVIVTHQRSDLARRCLEALMPDVRPAHVVVVINRPEGVPPADVEWLDERSASVVLNRRRIGYGANVNEGIRHLPGSLRYCLVLNDDAFVEPGALATLRDALELQPTAALAGPRLVDEAGHPEPARHRFPTVASELAGIVMAPHKVEALLARRFLAAPDSHDDAVPTWPVGAAFLARLEAFHSIGGFDEGFFLYSEETDLALRLRRQGWTTVFSDEARVVHIGGQSTDPRHQRMLGTSRWRYIRLHWRVSTQIVFVPLLAATYTWNTVYVLLRIVMAPGRYREKLAWWQSRWVKRPVPSWRRSGVDRP